MAEIQTLGLITLSEAGRLVSKDYRTIKSWCEVGVIPDRCFTYHPNGQIVIRKEPFLKFYEEREGKVA